MNLTFKDYELPVNPKKIELVTDTNIHCAPVYDGKSAVENVSVNPITVKCSGELYGKEGRQCCDRLQQLLREKQSGWLFAPEISPMDAFFTYFCFNRCAGRDAIAYEMRFTENCNEAKGLFELEYTVCKAGENVFDIAQRCCVTPEHIMQCNNFITPFDISEGERVELK